MALHQTKIIHTLELNFPTNIYAFYRVGGDTAKIEGTGLGLSIVKSACDEIGAKIALENRKEGGLRAKVTFKLS